MQIQTLAHAYTGVAIAADHRGDRPGLAAFAHLAQQLEHGQRLFRAVALEQHVHGAVAAEAEGQCGVLIVIVVLGGGAVTADHGFAAISQPPGLLRHFGLQATATDGAHGAAVERDQHARTGAAVGRAFDLDHGGEHGLAVVAFERAKGAEQGADSRQHRFLPGRFW